MHRRTARMGAVCVFALVIAACGSSSKASAPPATTGPGGSTAAASPSTGGSGGNTAATCNQITKAEVQPLVVNPITKVTATPSSDGKGQTCLFATANTSNAIAITVLPADDQVQNYAGDVQGITAVSVPGIGDQASRDGSHGTPILTSTKGNLYCSVTPESDDIPGVAQLEDAAGNTSNIGDKAYAEIAAAVGTLCNRIYGSGNTTPDLTDLVAAGHAAASQPTTTTALTLPTNLTLPTDGSTTP